MNTQNYPVPGPTYPTMYQAPPASRVPADTYLAGGGVPESIGVALFQIAALGAGIARNQATDVAGASTLNARSGNILTESLTTAAGSSFTFTLTNSAISASSTVLTTVVSGSNTQGAPQITAVVPAAGSVAITITNTDPVVALNGTLLVSFAVILPNNTL